MRPCAAAIGCAVSTARVQRARDQAGDRRRREELARRAPLARGRASVSGGSVRPWNRPSRLMAVCPCRSERDHPSVSIGSPTIAHPAGAHHRRAARTIGEAEPRPDPRGRGHAQQFEEHDDRPRRQQRRVRTSNPNAGHQNTSLFVQAPLNTSPANQPIARLSARRRRRRLPRPIVASMATVSNDDAREQRVRVRLVAERCIDQRAATPHRAR